MSAVEVLLLADMHPSELWVRTVGVYRLATELRSAGIQVKVLFGLTDFSPEKQKALLNHYLGSETKVVGFSTTFFGNHSKPPHGIIRNLYAKELIENLEGLKERNPHVDFVCGGANADEFNIKFIDYFVLGFADKFLVHLCKDKHAALKNLEFINDKKVIRWKESIPEVFDTVYCPEDRLHQNETLTIEISRGCRFKCKFCSYPLNGRKVNTYVKDKKTLQAEFRRNFESHQVTSYILSDDTFNESPDKLDFFIDAVEELPFRINFCGYFRLDLLEKQFKYVEKLMAIGLRGAFFGIESLNDKSAAAVGKPFGGSRAIKLLNRLKLEWGDEVVTAGGFIIGLPFDTMESVSSWVEDLADPDFPLHSKSLRTLYISDPESLSPWKSQFQLESKKYGYQVYKDLNLVKWKNEYWDYDIASNFTAEKVFELAKRGSQKNYGPFGVMMLMGLGFSFEEAKKIVPNVGKMNPLVYEKVKKRIEDHEQSELIFLDPKNVGCP